MTWNRKTSRGDRKDRYRRNRARRWRTLPRTFISDGIRESLRMIDGVDFSSVGLLDAFANEIVGGKLTILLDPTDHEKVVDALTSRGFVFRKISSLTQITGEPS